MPDPTDIAPASAAPSTEVSQNARLPRERRLLRRGEFVRVQQQGRRIHTAHFILLVLYPQPPDARGGGVRLGVTVGRRVGCAVRRNRVKRLVREVFRQNRALFPDHCDVVLVARPGADRLDYSAVRGELERAQAAIERVRQKWPTELQVASDS